MTQTAKAEVRPPCTVWEEVKFFTRGRECGGEKEEHDERSDWTLGSALEPVWAQEERISFSQGLHPHRVMMMMSFQLKGGDSNLLLGICFSL